MTPPLQVVVSLNKKLSISEHTEKQLQTTTLNEVHLKEGKGDCSPLQRLQLYMHMSLRTWNSLLSVSLISTAGMTMEWINCKDQVRGKVQCTCILTIFTWCM